MSATGSPPGGLENKEQRVVLAYSLDGQGDGIPVLIVGVPHASWVYMKDGKTNTLDLTGIGIPIKLIIFGGPDHAACMKQITDGIQAAGEAYLDERHTDFSMKPNGETNT